MERKTFLFYRYWSEVIASLPDAERLHIYEAAIEYATTGNLSKPVAGVEKVAFSFIKTDIDKDMEKYRKIIERNRQNGSKGSRTSTREKAG